MDNHHSKGYNCKMHQIKELTEEVGTDIPLVSSGQNHCVQEPVSCILQHTSLTCEGVIKLTGDPSIPNSANMDSNNGFKHETGNDLDLSIALNIQVYVPLQQEPLSCILEHQDHAFKGDEEIISDQIEPDFGNVDAYTGFHDDVQLTLDLIQTLNLQEYVTLPEEPVACILENSCEGDVQLITDEAHRESGNMGPRDCVADDTQDTLDLNLTLSITGHVSRSLVTDNISQNIDWNLSTVSSRRLEVPDQNITSQEARRDVPDPQQQEDTFIMPSTQQNIDIPHPQQQGDTLIIPSALQNIDSVWKWLNDKDVTKVAINGEPGTGKTWVARHVMDRVLATNLFETIVWVELGYHFQAHEKMRIRIVDQLKSEKEELKEVTTIELTHVLYQLVERMRVLLILNDMPSDISNTLADFGVPKGWGKYGPCESSKVLLTGLKSSTRHISTDRVQEVQSLSRDDAWLLFQKLTGLDKESPIIFKHIEPLLQKCNGLPFQIVNLGESAAIRSAAMLLKSKTYCDLLDLEKGLDEMFLCRMLPSKNMRECFLCCTMFSLNHNFSVRRLITYWMLRGFLDGFSCLEEAYKKGYDILQELIDCYLLFKCDDEHVELNILLRDHGIFAILSAQTFISKCFRTRSFRKMWKSFLVNEKMQIKFSEDDGETWDNSSLFLFYGKEGYLPRQISDLFNTNMGPIHLALLHVGIRSLSLHWNIRMLNVLILRGCSLLENVNQIRELRYLYVLILSDATSLREIPDDLFENLQSLIYLDLSNTQIKKLPSSISKLRLMLVIILRGCYYLETLPSLDSFKNLELLDLSGASSLIKIQNAPNSLKMLDLSGLPVENVASAYELEHLILRGCSEIKTLPHLDDFPKLKVLDLSGSRKFSEFQASGDESDDYWRSTAIFLKKLDLSETQIVEVQFLSAQFDLRELLLRSCCNFKTMPALSTKLEVLDLSGSVSFTNFQDESFGYRLTYLDLSKTRIEKLPMFPVKANLVQLLLRECECLEQLPTLVLEKLEVLDLSGSKNFKNFDGDSLERLCCLQTLDLSATQVASLPSLSKCSHLQQILLRKCLNLETLPHVKSLERLEVLDLSGASAFKNFQDDFLGKKEDFQVLNLSGTQVVQLPSLSECDNLRKLILSGCSKLEILPDLESVTRLEVLDLSKAISFVKFHDLFISHIQVLDLSETHIAEFSFRSGGSNLCQLSLRNCPNFQTLPPLDELTSLQVLDLSQTKITDFSSLSDCKNLCQILLNDCPNFPKLPPLKEHTNLEVIDLSGTKVQDYSFLSGCNNLYEISLRGCLNLETLSFEGMHNLRKVDLSETPVQVFQSSFQELRCLRQLLLKECSSLTTLPHLDILTKLELLDLSCTKTRKYPDDTYGRAHLRFLGIQNSDYQWNFDTVKSYQSFHFCLFDLKDHLKANDVYLQGQDYIFRYIYHQTNHILGLTEEPDKFFKLCGFETFPAGIEEVLIHVELLYLKKNDFIIRLSDLGVKTVKAMKECWIESCEKMKCVFHGEEDEENEAFGSCLQNISVSKLSHLKCVFGNGVQSDRFTCLKQLYIECCPRLVTVFSSHMELKNLEKLKIKFCEELENIFGEKVSGEDSFPRLKTMNLWKLPKLQSICGGVLPSLECFTVKGCLKLRKLPIDVNSSCSRVKIKGELVWWNNLKWEDESIKSNLHFRELPHAT